MAKLRLAYFSIIKGLFIYLTPSVPLSLKGEGEENKKEGLAPLLDTLFKAEVKDKSQGVSLYNRGWGWGVLEAKPMRAGWVGSKRTVKNGEGKWLDA